MKPTFCYRLVKAIFLLAIDKLVWIVQCIFSGLRILYQSSKIGIGYEFLPIFLTTVATLAIAACHSDTSALKQQHTISSATRSPIATQVVSHALGEVKIPVTPQRVVVLHDSLILDPVLSLDVEPVGIAYRSLKGERFLGIPNHLTVNIPEVGSISQPSIEKILSLKPDLILGVAFQKNYYELLSAIAPTVLIDFNDELRNFKERLRYIAQVLGKRERGEEILAQYQERIQQLRQQLGETLKGKTISFILLVGQNLYTFYTPKPDFIVSGQVINDVGLRFVSVQQNQKEPVLLSSIEVLPKYDADILFVADRTESIHESLPFLKQPIWSTLKAVKNKRVYEVNWSNGGVFEANKVLDDLFNYLVKTP